MENPPLVPDIKGQRTLAAIVFTDGVGFSAKMSVDEERTLDLIRRDLQLMREICWRFEGRVLKTTGDGLLMYFASAVQAVASAVEIQTQVMEAAALLPPDAVLSHRIGIHLGDVFISETDIMGNGVNIAARLQTLAEPGGICVSQTVYDVVKIAMTLNATHLGVRTLKNIKEPISVYHITPSPLALEREEDWSGEGDDSETILPQKAPAPTLFTKPQDVYEDVAQKLEREKHLARIKKLMYCVCKDEWEGDPAKLDALNLRNLCYDLHQLNPTAEQLKFNLGRIVRNLSKSAEYAPVAKIILREFKALYPEQQEPQRQLYAKVAQALDQDRNALRIKKLLFCVCRDCWENDQAKLVGLDIQDLLQELHEFVPTLARLRLALDTVVQTLSKKDEYTRVAQFILQQVAPLYGPDNQKPAPKPTPLRAPGEEPTELVPKFAAQPQKPMAGEEPTELSFSAAAAMAGEEPTALNFSAAMATETSPPGIPRPPLGIPTGSQFVPAASQPSPEGASPEDAPTGLMSEVTEAMTVPLPGGRGIGIGIGQIALPSASEVQDSLEAELDTELRPPIELFDIKQEIMSYTIPLRAKILVFSVLHHRFNYGDRNDWMLLREYRFDDLLFDVLKLCKSAAELERRLEIIASCLEESDEYNQAAAAIAQASKSFYATRVPETPEPRPVPITPSTGRLNSLLSLYSGSRPAATTDESTQQLPSPTGVPPTVQSPSENDEETRHLG